jgi:aminopeptidase
MRTFEDNMREYARIALQYGLGFDQRIRPLYINATAPDTEGFVAILAEEAYRMGVPHVEAIYRDARFDRAQFKFAQDENQLYVPQWVSARAAEIVANDGAFLAINGNGGLGIFNDVDPRLPSAFRSATMKANEPLTSRRMAMQQPWNIIDVPTEAWAKALGTTTDALWQFLFKICGADRENGVAYAMGNSETLHKRCELLNTLNIKELWFYGSGEGTNLTVGLSPAAKWLGGRKQDAHGVWFWPNWPSFEVFTTPDWRRTDGWVRVTMPSNLSGQIVDGVFLHFKEGRIIDASAKKGQDALRSLIGTDVGAAQLGEIAMVGLDAPLSAHVDPHLCVLLDENKRCHLAVGRAYAAALRGGPDMSEAELEELGCNGFGANLSNVHHDMMISDESTRVIALGYDRRETHLMAQGHWLPPFDCK